MGGVDVPVQNRNKVYVEVLAAFSKNGELTPRSIRWIDGRIFDVDQVIDVREAASLRAGGLAKRYTCLVEGSPCFLFCEDNNRWFVQARQEI